METAREIGSPDDVTMGFLLNGIKGVKVTEWPTIQFDNKRISIGDSGSLKWLKKQTSFLLNRNNHVIFINSKVAQSFPESVDPTRLYSIHCLIKPETFYCNKINDLNRDAGTG